MARRHSSFRHSIGSNESQKCKKKNRTVSILTSLFENLLFGCLTIRPKSAGRYVKKVGDLFFLGGPTKFVVGSEGTYTYQHNEFSNATFFMSLFFKV